MKDINSNINIDNNITNNPSQNVSPELQTCIHQIKRAIHEIKDAKDYLKDDDYHKATTELIDAIRYVSKAYKSINELKPAITVEAGPNQNIVLPDGAALSGTVTIEGVPVTGLDTTWSKVSGPGVVVFTDSKQLATIANFSEVGDYVLRLTAINPATAVSGSDDVTIKVDAIHRTYTTDADFNEGTKINLSNEVPGQLQLDDTVQQLNYMWVAVSSKGTIVKINTDTGEVIGEYYTSPHDQPKNPSRTTVDLNGNVWATNRDGNSVVCVGLVENGQWIDKNGDGKCNTSKGLGDIKPWTNEGGADTNGGVSTAEDECILHYTRISSYGARHVSVDEDNNVWASGTDNRMFDLINGENGKIIRTEPSVGYGGYGGLIDPNGVIWSARKLLRWDTSKPLTGPNGENWKGYEHDSYGLAIDSQGNVWNTSYEGSCIYKFAPDGTLIGQYQHGFKYAQGCVVDKNDDVWVAHSLNGSNTVGHLKNDGTFVGNVVVGDGPTGVAVDSNGKIWATNYNSCNVSRIDPNAGPIGEDGKTHVGEVDFTTVNLGGNLYNYSDMTGSTLIGAPKQGSWTVVYDSGRSGLEWGAIGWNGTIYNDGLIRVSVASSENGIDFSELQNVSNYSSFTVPAGRYLKVIVSLKRSSDGKSPIFTDITIGAKGYKLPIVTNQPPQVNAGMDAAVAINQQLQLEGEVEDDCLPDGLMLNISWSKVSGPGDVTFYNSAGPSWVKASFGAVGEYELRLTASDSVSSSSDTILVTVTPRNMPPVVDAGPDQSIVLPAAASLNGSVTDDGLPSADLTINWSKVSGPGVVVFADSQNPVTQASFSTAGDYVLSLTASDSQFTTSDTVNITVKAANLPPVVDAGPDQSIVLPDEAFLSGTATDDGIPGPDLIINWSKVSGPGEVTFTNPNQAITTAKFTMVGEYVLRLTASDTIYSSSDTTRVLVKAANQAPVVDAGLDQSITLPATASLNGSVTDDGLPSADLTITWSKVSGPGEVTFANPSQLVTTASFSMAGVYTLRLTASDSLLSSSDTVNVTVEAGTVPIDYERPVVQLSIDAAQVNVGDIVNITVNATDNIGVVSKELKINGITVALDNSGKAEYTTVTTGVFTVEASALDAAGNEGNADGEFTVLTSGDTVPPVVSFSSPDEDSKFYMPTVIKGTATDDNFMIYKLEYSEQGKDEFIEFASGTTSVVDNTLGTFDPTKLINGFYDVKLTAIDTSGNTSYATRTFEVAGQAKIGNFSIEFNDLTIPVSGMPITIVRSYDTRNALKGDFGIGWTLKLQNIKLSESCILGENWEQVKQGVGIPSYYIVETKSHIITVTYPNGKTDKFFMQIDDNGQIVPIESTTVSFSPLYGTFSKLESLDNNSCLVTQSLGPTELLDDISLEPYNPSRYKLTQKDGTVLIINQSTGLESITDRNGNTITLGSTGINHSAGKNVAFERDSQGRITTITDLLGNKINYSYDYYGDLVAVTNQAGETTRFTYNSIHQIVDIVSPTGIVPSRNLYDDDGRLITQIDSDGNRIEYTHDIGARQEIVTDRLGNQTVMSYDERGNILSKTDAMGDITSYTYDLLDNLLTETDALNNTTSYTYDSNNNKTSETNALGYTTEYTYDNMGNVLTTKDPLGYITTNTYDAHGNLLSTKDPLSNETKYEYDSSGNKIKVTNPLGNIQVYTYDQYGNMMSSTDFSGNSTKYTYDTNGNQLTKTTRRTVIAVYVPEDIITTKVYDDLNRIVEIIDPYNYSTKIEYNSIGKKSADVDALGNRTEYQYDDFENLVQILYADGSKKIMTYDLEGNMLSSTDEDGKTTNYEYDKNKRLIKTTYADGRSRGIEYDKAGNKVKAIDERGFATIYAYDAAYRNISVTDAAGKITFYEYDKNNNRTKRTDANGHVTSYNYDGNYRVTQTIFNDSTIISIQYDSVGNKVQEIDQSGFITKFDYNANGLLIYVTDANGNQTQYGYDEVGNQTFQYDANAHVTRYEYNKLGKRTKRILPLGMFETFEYDAKERVTAHTDFNGNTTHYQYDVRDREVKEIAPDDKEVTFTYTLNGQRKSVKDSRGTTAYQYDMRNRLLKQTNPDLAEISYAYDGAGNRVSITILSGITYYEYDGMNRLIKVTAPDGGQTIYAYDAVGNRFTESRANGVVTEYTYDTLNRLAKLLNKNANDDVISSYEYMLDLSGIKVRVTEASGRFVDYSYDSTYKLTEERIVDTVAGNRTIDYSYDAVGNRLIKNDNGSVTNYTYDDNDRMLTAAYLTYTYDNNGNTIRKDSAPGVAETYSYDNNNRLVSTTAYYSNGQTFTLDYVYNSEGIKVQRKYAGSVDTYLVDENRDYAQVLEQRNTNGNLTVRYVYGDDLISQTRDNNISYYLYDGNMSTRSLTDKDGVQTDTYTYDAFGVIIDRTDNVVNEYLYTGEQIDLNLGFYYLRSRYMNPDAGRFITIDEYEGNRFEPLTLHKYLYAKADPVNNVDPSGRDLLGLLMGIYTIYSIISEYVIPLYTMGQKLQKVVSNIDEIGKYYKELPKDSEKRKEMDFWLDLCFNKTVETATAKEIHDIAFRYDQQYALKVMKDLSAATREGIDTSYKIWGK